MEDSKERVCFDFLEIKGPNESLSGDAALSKRQSSRYSVFLDFASQDSLF